MNPLNDLEVNEEWLGEEREEEMKKWGKVVKVWTHF